MARTHVYSAALHPVKRSPSTYRSYFSGAAKQNRLFSGLIGNGKPPYYVRRRLYTRIFVVTSKKASLFGGYVLNLRGKTTRTGQRGNLPISNKPKIKDIPRVLSCAPSSSIFATGKLYSHMGRSSSCVKAAECPRAAPQPLKHNLSGRYVSNSISKITDIQHWRLLVSDKSENTETATPTIGRLTSGGRYTMDAPNDVTIECVSPVNRDTISLTDVEMGEPGEGWAEMEVCDDDAYMEGSVQGFIDSEAAVKDHEEGCFLPNTPTSEYSSASSTATLVDEDMDIANSEGSPTPVSANFPEVAFALTNPNADACPL